MEPDNTKQLVKTIKHLMVDKGVQIGHWIELRDKLSEKLGRSVHRNTFYNALSGHRSGAPAQAVLNALRTVLEDMPDI